MEIETSSSDPYREASGEMNSHLHVFSDIHGEKIYILSSVPTSPYAWD